VVLVRRTLGRATAGHQCLAVEVAVGHVAARHPKALQVLQFLEAKGGRVARRI
jgi:hypothetical protein